MALSDGIVENLLKGVDCWCWRLKMGSFGNSCWLSDVGFFMRPDPAFGIAPRVGGA